MQENQERRTGTVVHAEKERGYFFIQYQGRRIFCHVSRWSELEMPQVNDQVSFEVGPAKKP
jgi:cold shock CspA family protein